MTIKNPDALIKVSSRWRHDQSVLREAASVLDAAICQQDIELALQAPTYDLSVRSRPPEVWNLVALATLMMGYELTETAVTAEVVIIP